MGSLCAPVAWLTADEHGTRIGPHACKPTPFSLSLIKSGVDTVPWLAFAGVSRCMQPRAGRACHERDAAVQLQALRDEVAVQAHGDIVLRVRGWPAARGEHRLSVTATCGKGNTTALAPLMARLATHACAA